MSEKFENTENMETVEKQLADGELEQVDGGGLGYLSYQRPKFNIFCPFCNNTHNVELWGTGPFQIEGSTPQKYMCTNQGRFFLLVIKGGHYNYYTGNGNFIMTK